MRSFLVAALQSGSSTTANRAALAENGVGGFVRRTGNPQAQGFPRQ
jgi:hypothetical protein